jgi:endonuclease/exonuclease/phosphatase family metal-dependent hydrolase
MADGTHPAGRRWAARLLAVATALGTLSCATTHNYLDPAGPRYEGGFADAASPALQRPADGPIRVVTFNIEFAREIDRALALLRDSAALRDPDILLLQEMDPPGVARIARELHLNYVYFPSTVNPMAHRDFGTAVLSPWPLDDARKLVLPHAAFGTRARRAATSAVVHRGAFRIRAVAVHLSAPGAIRDEEREEQVRLITDDAARTGDPVVVGGDFNSRAVAQVFKARGFLWLTGKLPGTSRGMGHWWSYDHVFTWGLTAAPDGPAAGVVDPAGASDHRPVWVRLVAQNVR